jgi:hypothetical protein
MELEVRHVTPHEFQRMTRRLIAQGVQKRLRGGGVSDPLPGKERQYALALADLCVTNWRNIRIGGEVDPPYDVEKMADIICKSTSVNRALVDMIEEEGDFFPANGSASNG